MTEDDFKKFVESYKCRICKQPLNLDNLGGLGENHMIFCKDCRFEVAASGYAFNMDSQRYEKGK